MLTPNYPLPEHIKKVLHECKDFNKDNKTVEEIEKELGLEINPLTARRYAKAINMANNLDELKEILQYELEEEEMEEEIEEVE